MNELQTVHHGVLMLPGGVARSRMNWGRWIVDCQAPRCGSALWVPARPTFDQLFGRWLEGRPAAAQCWDCGYRFGIEWPSEDMVASVERILSFRKDPNTRNWDWSEDLGDLVAQNAAVGEHVPVGELEPGSGVLDELPAGSIFRFEGDRITLDRLAPTGPLLPAVGAPQRPPTLPSTPPQQPRIGG